MWVKICANTNLEDALLAAELGANAVGFVFAPSVRQVTTDQVARITSHLPDSLERVGVFPAWSSQQISATVRDAGLTAVQLHGVFDPELVCRLNEEFSGKLPMIQTVHWAVGGTNAKQIESQVRAELNRVAREAPVERLLVDSKVGTHTGGTGIAFDWFTARSIFTSVEVSPKLILAGGLTPDNIASAITQLHPWGVDVASGVEASVGRKDSEKLTRFFRQISRIESTADNLRSLSTPHAREEV